MKNIYLITFMSMIPITGCSKKRHNPQPDAPQEIAEIEKPVDLNTCSPESQTEPCKQLTQKIDEQNEAHKRDLENLRNELNTIKENSANEVIKLTEEKAVVATEITAIKTSIAQQNDFAKNLDELSAKLKTKEDELEKLKGQTPAADGNGQQERLVNAANTELLRLQKALMDTYVSLLRQQLLNFERLKKSEEKPEPNAEKQELFKTRIAELQKEIEEMQTAAKTDDAATIKPQITKIMERLPGIKESLSKSQDEQRNEIAQLEGSLTQKTKDLDEATKKLGDATTLNREKQDQLNAVNERLMAIFKDQYQTLDSLEAAMVPYVRVTTGSTDPAVLPKKLEEISASLDSQKAPVEACRQQNQSQSLTGQCVKTSQQYYFTLRQKRLMLIQQERNKILPSGNLSVLGPEAKQNLKVLWDNYTKTSGLVADFRVGKKITEKELADLKAYYAG